MLVKLRLFLLLILFSGNSFCQIKNQIIVFENTEKKEDKSIKLTNTFSVLHALKVAGIPYDTTTFFDSILRSKIIFFTEPLTENQFNEAEVALLYDFVEKGGTIIGSQLKNDDLYNLFGISGYKFKTNRKEIFWNTKNTVEEAYLINDSNEFHQYLADSNTTQLFGTRAFTLSTGLPFLLFENNENAGVINQFGKGYTYLFGFNFEDVILRNQVLKHFKANRTYSNGFEPGSDVLYHFIRGIYRKHVPFATHKHTSINNSKSLLIITHDVDATSAIKDIMTDFSSYEYENNIRTSYFVTTHYMHDSVAKNFWDGYTNEIKSVLSKKHEVASHSVSHTPDFDNSSIVTIGDCESLNHENYKPFYDGKVSNNVFVCGETKVSKSLLDTYAGANVKSFRAGYLAYNKGILEALENSNYTFNSSHSANNVLTGYPFQGHLNLSMNAEESHIYEIPNTISDVFMEERISEENYNQKVAIWTDVQKRYQENETPVVLLIHPNRPWKIIAQQNFTKNLTSNVAIIPFDEYGYFWKNREQLVFNQFVNSDSTVIVKIESDSLPNYSSFIIHDGQYAKKIILLNNQNDTITYQSANWETTDLIIFNTEFKESYTDFEYIENYTFRNIDIYPNPVNETFSFHIELVNDADIKFEIYDHQGRAIIIPYDKRFELGEYKLPISIEKFNQGIYFYRIYVNGEVVKKGKIAKN
jgi:hypothetical protein